MLPICSLNDSPKAVAQLGELVLPPLFADALDAHLQTALVDRIVECFPYHAATGKRTFAAPLRVVEYKPEAQAKGLNSKAQAPHGIAPSLGRASGFNQVHDDARRPGGRKADVPVRVLAFSIDTAVEQHGPHLPLATDRIQSYAVLSRAIEGLEGVVLGPPVDYGHLVWGLPIGLSIDIPPPLLSRYIASFAAAVTAWSGAESLYVVDVHGSPAHRQAIQTGLQASNVRRWRFRWLHEPLLPFAAERGDQHAGAVETVIMNQISPQLVDSRWWPARSAELAAGQMSFEQALELTPDLPRFFEHARNRPWNGIVGKIESAPMLDGALLLQAMIDVARNDLTDLLA